MSQNSRFSAIANYWLLIPAIVIVLRLIVKVESIEQKKIGSINTSEQKVATINLPYHLFLSLPFGAVDFRAVKYGVKSFESNDELLFFCQFQRCYCWRGEKLDRMKKFSRRDPGLWLTYCRDFVVVGIMVCEIVDGCRCCRTTTASETAADDGRDITADD
uniref:Uncharacterized protein n=1 Tax=Glossina austeni TaxID=7395 RepID=A0A1A9UWM1_GLOAU